MDWTARPAMVTVENKAARHCVYQVDVDKSCKTLMMTVNEHCQFTYLFTYHKRKAEFLSVV